MHFHDGNSFSAVVIARLAHVWKSLRGMLVMRYADNRTTTKFTTTTSVDRESTGTRTSVSAGNRELKMQSLGRTTTALNVNKLLVRDKVFSQWRLLKQCKIFFF